MKKTLALVHGDYICHTIRVLEVAKKLRETGEYDVVFSGNGKYIDELVIPAGFRNIPTEQLSKRKISDTVEQKFIPQMFDKSDADKFYDIEFNLLTKEKPDIILRDHFREFAGIAAKKKGVYDVFIELASCSPYCTASFRPSTFPKLLDKLIPEAVVRPFGPKIFKLAKKKAQEHIYNKVREVGLNLREDLPSGFEADLTLFGDEEKLFPLKGLNETHKFIGPPLCFDNYDAPVWLNDFKNDPRKKILVTSGTTGEHEKTELIAKIFEDQKFAVAVYANNGKLPKGFFGGDNFNINEVLPFADVAVTHGGLGAIYTALKNQTPVLAIPHQVEQDINAYCLQKSGAGMYLFFKKSSVSKIRQGIETILGDPRFMQQAKEFSRIMNSKNPAKLAVKHIQEGHERFKRN